jgi:hypothetical protein
MPTRAIGGYVQLIDNRSNSALIAEVNSAALSNRHRNRRAARQKRHLQALDLIAAPALWSPWVEKALTAGDAPLYQLRALSRVKCRLGWSA